MVTPWAADVNRCFLVFLFYSPLDTPPPPGQHRGTMDNKLKINGPSPPLVLGGQGRDAADLMDAANMITIIMVVAAVGALIALAVLR